MKPFIAALVISTLCLAGCTAKTPPTVSTPTPSAIGQTVSVAPSTPSATSFTLADVSQHNTVSDCWMVIDSNVYDVSNYMSQHPSMQIIQGCGKDATKLFRAIPNHQGGQAQSILPRLQVGKLK